MIFKMIEKKIFVFLTLIYTITFSSNFSYAKVTLLEDMDIIVVFFFSNIITMIAFIYSTEKIQNMFEMLKYRSKKYTKLFIKTNYLQIKYSLFFLIIISLAYVLFCFLVNKYVLIPWCLLRIINVFLGVVLVRSILALILKPRVTSIILLMFFCLNLALNNLFPGSFIVNLNHWLNIFDMHILDLSLIKTICYLAIFGVILIIMKFKVNAIVVRIINKLNMMVILVMAFLAFFILNLVSHQTFDINILFFSKLYYNNFFEFIIFNFIFYFILIFNLTTYLYNINGGIYQYYLYRIKERIKIKLFILKRINLRLLVNVALILLVNIIIIMSGKYETTITQFIMDIVKLLSVMLLINYLALIGNKIIENRIIFMSIVYTLLMIALTQVNIYFLAAALVFMVAVLIFKKELI